MKIKPETYYCMWLAALWLNTQRAGVGVKGYTSERSGNGKQFSECFQKPWLLIFNVYYSVILEVLHISLRQSTPLLECYFKDLHT
jgi:hypothetical protein